MVFSSIVGTEGVSHACSKPVAAVMSGRVMLLILCSLNLPAAHSAPSADPKPLGGSYQIHGGSLAEMQPPSPCDAHVTFRFKGRSASDLFDSIGPDVKKQDACSGVAGYRERRRGHLLCVRTKEDGPACYLGLDLRKGKSDAGAVC